jgi:hypothetical protein
MFEHDEPQSVEVIIEINIGEKMYRVQDCRYVVTDSADAKSLASDLLNVLGYELHAALEAEKEVYNNVYTLKNQDDK